MAGAKILKRDNLKDNDWIFLHREPSGLGVPKVIDGIEKRYAMKARDFFSDMLTSPVSDTDSANAGVENLLMRPVGFRAGQPVVADVDRIVTVTEMIVGAYTVAQASAAGGVALNVTVTHADDGGTDTLGTVDIVGTDIDDQVLLETITPGANATVQGTQAFKTVVSVTGVAWVTNGNADDITVGFGELIGLPDYLLHDTVLFALLNNVREATHPTVTSSTTVLALNTVDLNTALGGTVVVIYYLAGKWI
jgi:hypothetical protein